MASAALSSVNGNVGGPTMNDNKIRTRLAAWFRRIFKRPKKKERYRPERHYMRGSRSASKRPPKPPQD